MGPICAIVLEGGKDAKVGMVMFESPCMELIVWQSPIAITITGFLPWCHKDGEACRVFWQFCNGLVGKYGHTGAEHVETRHEQVCETETIFPTFSILPWSVSFPVKSSTGMWDQCWLGNFYSFADEKQQRDCRLLFRNKILVSNDLPNNTEIEKAMGDLARLSTLEINKVLHSPL